MVPLLPTLSLGRRKFLLNIWGVRDAGGECGGDDNSDDSGGCYNHSGGDGGGSGGNCGNGDSSDHRIKRNYLFIFFVMVKIMVYDD